MNIEDAIQLAVKYHGYQYRANVINGLKMPYIIHPLEVCKKVWLWGIGDEDVMIAAILHDVVEDSILTAQDIENQFGPKIAKIVEELTFKPEENWSKEEKAKRKEEYIRSFKTKSCAALILKLADRLSNVMDYFYVDPKRAKKYFHKADDLYDTILKRKKDILEQFGQDVVAGMLKDFNLVNGLVNGG